MQDWQERRLRAMIADYKKIGLTSHQISRAVHNFVATSPVFQNPHPIDRSIVNRFLHVEKLPQLVHSELTDPEFLPDSP